MGGDRGSLTPAEARWPEGAEPERGRTLRRGRERLERSRINDNCRTTYIGGGVYQEETA